MGKSHFNKRTKFSLINASALKNIDSVMRWLLPQGRRRGNEWVALNPHRDDQSLGSFSINMTTGRWCDFAIGERGGDIISLVAYLRQKRQGEAAGILREYLGGYYV